MGTVGNCEIWFVWRTTPEKTVQEPRGETKNKKNNNSNNITEDSEGKIRRVMINDQKSIVHVLFSVKCHAYFFKASR